jgi:hypothetical protein
LQILLIFTLKQLKKRRCAKDGSKNISKMPKFFFAIFCFFSNFYTFFSSISTVKKPSYTVHPAPFAFEVPGFREFPYHGFLATFFLSPLALMLFFQTPLWSYPLLFLATFAPSWVLYVLADSVVKNWAFAEKNKVCFDTFPPLIHKDSWSETY